ncbi:membrane hypothetical protein [Vibrio chagasii]|nr:membrane hypothetical protein [Vibrio chagasii]
MAFRLIHLIWATLPIIAYNTENYILTVLFGLLIQVIHLPTPEYRTAHQKHPDTGSDWLNNKVSSFNSWVHPMLSALGDCHPTYNLVSTRTIGAVSQFKAALGLSITNAALLLAFWDSITYTLRGESIIFNEIGFLVFAIVCSGASLQMGTKAIREMCLKVMCFNLAMSAVVVLLTTCEWYDYFSQGSLVLEQIGIGLLIILFFAILYKTSTKAVSASKSVNAAACYITKKKKGCKFIVAILTQLSVLMLGVAFMQKVTDIELGILTEFIIVSVFAAVRFSPVIVATLNFDFNENGELTEDKDSTKRYMLTLAQSVVIFPITHLVLAISVSLALGQPDIGSDLSSKSNFNQYNYAFIKETGDIQKMQSFESIIADIEPSSPLMKSLAQSYYLKDSPDVVLLFQNDGMNDIAKALVSTYHSDEDDAIMAESLLSNHLVEHLNLNKIKYVDEDTKLRAEAVLEAIAFRNISGMNSADKLRLSDLKKGVGSQTIAMLYSIQNWERNEAALVQPPVIDSEFLEEYYSYIELIDKSKANQVNCKLHKGAIGCLP